MAKVNIKSGDQYLYFLYSEQQFKDRKAVENSLAKAFKLGIIIVNGQKKYFTEVSKKPTNRYPDTKVIAEGYKSEMNYTLPQSI